MSHTLSKTARHRLVKCLLSAIFIAPAYAQAKLIGYDYINVDGEEVKGVPADTYANPAEGMDFYLQAGVDRKVRLELRNARGQIVEMVTSKILGATDKITFDGAESYGAKLSLPQLSEGAYQLHSLIIASNERVVHKQVDDLVIQREAPTIGDVVITQSHTPSDNHAGTWGKPTLSPNRFVDLTINDITSGTDIGSIEGRVLNEEGQVISTQTTKISRGGARFPRRLMPNLNTEGEFSFEFEVRDKAGNTTAKVFPFFYDKDNGVSKHGRMSPIAILDPPQYQGQSLGGGFKLDGYVPYEDGMTISTNPIYAIFKIKKENFIKNSPYGIGRKWGNAPQVSQDVVHDDGEYVYVRSEGHGKPNLLEHGQHSIVYHSRDSMLNQHNAEPISFTLADSALIGPDSKKTTIHFSDGSTLESRGGGGNSRYLPTAGDGGEKIYITSATVEVEPRPYRQRVFFVLSKLSHQSAYVEPGETEATVDLNNLDLYSHAQAGDHIFWRMYHRIYGMGDGDAFSTANIHHMDVYVDIEPPEVGEIIHDHDDETVTVNTYETAEKYYATHSHYGHYYVDFNASEAMMRSKDGDWLTLERKKQILNSHWDRDFIYSTSSLPEGLYTEVKAEVTDRFKNTTVKRTGGKFLVDRTAPEVSIEALGTINSLDDITINVTDNLDDDPRITRATVSGGPNDIQVDLAAVKERASKNSYKLEYPVLFPSLETGGAYGLAITSVDESGNSVTENIQFDYSPPLVELDYGDGRVAHLPALSMPFYRPNGARFIESKPLRLRDDSLVVGQYQLTATMSEDSEIPIILSGQRLNPGETMVVNDNYDFSASNSRISLSAYPAEDGVLGSSSLLLSTSAPNAPILIANVTTWLPDISLTSDNWEVKQLVDLVDIRAEGNIDTTCRVTMDESEARRSDTIISPVCYMEWSNKPIETEVVAKGSGDRHISKLFGNAVTLGEQEVSYELFIFSATGEKVKAGEGSRALTVVDASDSVTASIKPKLEDALQHIRPISGTLVGEDNSRCRFYTDMREAQEVASKIPYDSDVLACHIGITDLPDGVDVLSGSRPSFGGTIAEAGEASISWGITAFSRTGVEVLVGNQTHTFDVGVPALPQIDMITENSGRRAFEGKNREEGIPENEFVAIPHGSRTLGKAFFKSDPGALVITGHTNGSQEPVFQEDLRMPISSSERLVTARISGDETLPLFSTVTIDLEAYYTEMPSLLSKRKVDAVVVPGSRVQPYLYADGGQRNVLNTESTRVRAEIGDPRQGGAYDANGMGEWDVRIVKEVSRGEYEPITDFKHAQGGSALFDITPEGEEGGNIRLLTEARLRSPISEYERTEYSTSPLYLTVLEGNPLNAKIKSRTLSGSAPYRAIFQVAFDNTSDIRSSGAIEWRVRQEGDSDWDVDQREENDRTRLRKSVEFLEPGTYEIEAVVTNIHSGAKSTAQAAKVIVYDLPELKLDGARSAFLGDTLTMKAVITNSDGVEVPDSELSILWSDDLGDSWQEGGSTFDITRSEPGNTNVWVRAKPALAPDDDSRAWVKGRTGVSFGQIISPRFYVQGPRQVEIGVEYEFKVRTMIPYRGFNRDTKGYFKLPNGDTIEGEDTITYTPTEEDLPNGLMSIHYVGWIDGYRDETTAEDTLQTRVWEYVWPLWGQQR